MSYSISYADGSVGPTAVKFSTNTQDWRDILSGVKSVVYAHLLNNGVLAAIWHNGALVVNDLTTKNGLDPISGP